MKKDDRESVLELYKLYVNTAENVSTRRQTVNNYFLTINSALLALSGYLTTTTAIKIWYLIIAVMGILISFFWIVLIQSYKNLNSAKFHLIHKLEKELPFKLFEEEWEFLGKGETKKYVKLTTIERAVPIVFIGLYTLIILSLLVELLTGFTT